MKKLRTKKKSLKKQVEIVHEPSLDGEDPDLLEYVNAFLHSYSQLPALPQTSLATKEEAVRALAVLERAHERVQSHLRTAKALKQLLEAKKSGLETEN